MFIDSATIQVRSGKGGDGCVSFLRAKFVPKGGPDGGDGGRGGSVLAVVDSKVATLLDFAGHHLWQASNGQPGMSKQRHGRGGAELQMRLPLGTLVYDQMSGQLIADLNKAGQTVVLAEGGTGGWGNEHFKSATNQSPTHFTPGGAAQDLTLRLELKLIADVGLVGRPNAGKSTLLARISRATPKIADYPFTTLSAQLGIAELVGHDRRRLVVADIPGLIANAHQGRGLGTRFLRHIERTWLLVHMVEVDPVDGSDPVANYHVIRRELRCYSPRLMEKPELVVLSKMDLVSGEQERARVIAKLEKDLGGQVYPISAISGLGLNQLLEASWARRTRGRKDP